MKKTICLLLGLILVLGAMTACSQNDAPQNTTASINAETTTGTETTQGQEQIVVKMGICPGETDIEEAWESYNASVEAFQEANPNVTIENAKYDYSPDTFIPMAESGNLPVAFQTWFSEPAKLISNGYVADITDILEERGWLDSMNPTVRSILSDENGRVYGIPASGYGLGLYQNVDLFKEAGLVDEKGYPLTPSTWEEVAEFAKQIAEKTGNPGICILAQDNAAGWHFTNIAWDFGAAFSVKNEDGTYTATVNTPEAIEAMNFLKDLKWNSNALTADPLSENNGTALAHMGAGTVGMIIGGSDAMGAILDNGGRLGGFALRPLPAGPKGQYTLFGGTPVMFSSKASEAQINAALDFLEMHNAYGPEIDEAVMETQIKLDAQAGHAVVPRFKIWNDPETNEITERLTEKHGNIDPALYESFFEMTVKEGNLHLEEPAATQDLYAELTKVIQAVMTDENADVAALMETANNNYQIILDTMK